MTATEGAPAPDDVDPRFARSAARWLAAYPRRWRATRTAEVVDLLADLAPPGARRLDLRSGIGLVRAGWATRWRQHPPLLPWLGYVLLERRLDVRYREWVRDDVEGWLFTVRRALLTGSLVLAFVASLGWGDGAAPTQFLAVWLPGAVGVTVLWGRVLRDRMIEKHLVIRPGDVVTSAARVHAVVARTRVDARTWTAAASTWLAATVTACAVVLALGDRMVVAATCGRACGTVDTVVVTPGFRQAVALVAGAALLLGALLVPLARRRLHRWVPTPQPARWVTPLGVHGVVRAVTAGVGLTGVAVALPELAAGTAAPVLVVAALALPATVAAHRVVAVGGTRATAGIEVVRAALGRTDPADRAVPGFLPATTWLPAGTTAPLPGAPPHATPPPAVDRTDPYRPGAA